MTAHRFGSVVGPIAGDDGAPQGQALDQLMRSASSHVGS